MNATEIRKIKYEDCRLCEDSDTCDRMAIKDCKEQLKKSITLAASQFTDK